MIVSDFNFFSEKLKSRAAKSRGNKPSKKLSTNNSVNSRGGNIILPPIKDTRGLGAGPGLANPDPFKHPHPHHV